MKGVEQFIVHKEMLSDERKKILKRLIPISIIAIICVIVAFIMLKYEVEGEKNLPFKLTKISTISTANGIPNTETMDKWNFNLVQNNDLYFTFEKNKDVKQAAYINKIAIENINITSKPAKGETYFYSPSKEAVDWFDNNEIYRIKNNLEYIGNTESNVKELKIGNQGGIIGIRYSIEDLGTYISEEDEIKHDGMLLESIGITEEDLQSKVEFDLVLELNTGIKYKARVNVELPNADVLREGISKTEETELEDIVFKRF